jgi:hypothetical protein
MTKYLRVADYSRMECDTTLFETGSDICRNLLLPFSEYKMDAADLYVLLVPIYQPAMCHMEEDGNFIVQCN